jgi:hypothetical protein
MRQLLPSYVWLAVRALSVALVASSVAAQVPSEVLFAESLHLSGQLSDVCSAPNSEDQAQASRAASKGTRCSKAIGRSLADRALLDRDWFTREQTIGGCCSKAFVDVARVSDGGGTAKHTSIQSTGPPAGDGRKVVSIVAGLALAGGGVYLVATSRGWAEFDLANPSGQRPCMSTRNSELARRCYTNRIAIGVPLFVIGGGLVAWGFGVP